MDCNLRKTNNTQKKSHRSIYEKDNLTKMVNAVRLYSSLSIPYGAQGVLQNLTFTYFRTYLLSW